MSRGLTYESKKERREWSDRAREVEEKGGREKRELTFMNISSYDSYITREIELISLSLGSRLNEWVVGGMTYLLLLQIDELRTLEQISSVSLLELGLFVEVKKAVVS